MSKVKKIIVLSIVIALTIYIFSFFLNCFIKNNFSFSFNIKLLFDAKTFIYSGVLDTVALIFFMSYEYKHYWTKRARKFISGDKENIIGNLENSHFQDDKELKRNFTHCTLETLPAEKAGIPIKAVEEQNTINIYLAKPNHTLVIGTTGSGKTTAFIDPTIQILSRTKDKPSMIVADPKGELYLRHGSTLKQKGYEVIVIDLRQPYNSIRWNPLEPAFEFHKQATSSSGVKAQTLEDAAYDLLNDIAISLSPITSKDDPIWERGAKNFILGSLLAMLNDKSMTKDKFIFYNLMKLCQLKEQDIRAYFRACNCPVADGLVNQVLNSAEKTKASYLSTIADKLSIFSDTAICAFTSQNEFNYNNLIDKPSVLFLQIADEKIGRHKIASLFISQTYKQFADIANKSPLNSLSRPVYFLLDEFGNLPAISNIEQMITVGRSRNIWFNLVIQSYTQLYKIYGHDIAETIRSNCNIQIFIGTNDEKTTSEFSKLCGNYTVDATSVGTNTQTKEISPHISLKERPLIYPTELAKLNSGKEIGNAIVSIFGYSPIKSKFTPSFKTHLYRFIKQKSKSNAPRYFDIKAHELKFNNDYETQQDEGIENIKEYIIQLDCIQEENKIYLLNLLEKGMYNKVISILQATQEKASTGQIQIIKKIINTIYAL